MIYIFDVDGTLTKSRNVIDPKFKTFFEHFISNNRVWLISGSDKDKTIEQLGFNIWGAVERAYQCSGNQLFVNGELVKENKFNHPYIPILLEQFLLKSEYKNQYGNHIEERPGTINFSTVGRNCTQSQREEYFEWDKVHKEREHFVWEITERYPWLDATVGGEISIDIYNRGEDKGQIVKDVDTVFTFFGDRLQPGGNDYPILRECINNKLKNKFKEVKNWQETFNILKNE